MVSHRQLVDELIAACFDAAWVQYNLEGFERFANRCKERMETTS
jgi:hypothetical protein